MGEMIYRFSGVPRPAVEEKLWNHASRHHERSSGQQTSRIGTRLECRYEQL